MLATTLATAPDGVTEALALVDGLDDALTHGLARVDAEHAARLDSLATAFAGSPLADRITDAVDKIIAGTVTDEHLIALAGARTALLGAAHDALLAGLDADLRRTREALPAAPAAEPGDTGLTGSSAWLRELAITGWRGVDHELAAAATATVQALLKDPARRRLAVLLDGFAGELRAAAPVATLTRVPVRRWADLWSRGLLLSRPAVPDHPAAPVSGRLLILGVDLHEHPTVFRAQVHGLLETTGGVRLIRTSVAAAKVDSITGPSAWRLLAGYPILLGALVGHHSVAVTGMPATATGDLIWHEAQARPGNRSIRSRSPGFSWVRRSPRPPHRSIGTRRRSQSPCCWRATRPAATRSIWAGADCRSISIGCRPPGR